eukprot:scaffold3611_cov364-Prasinococcus_capsulatus_cf.AAC.4
MLHFLCIAALLLCGGLVVPASGELTWIPFSELQAQVEQLVEEGTISAAQGNAVLADAYEMHLKQVADDAQRELEEAVEEVPKTPSERSKAHLLASSPFQVNRAGTVSVSLPFAC